MKPIIGISSRVQDKENQILRASYVKSVRNAGGIPILVPINPLANTEEYASLVDGYLIPGGIDVTPLLYGEQPHPNVKLTFREIDLGEFAIIRALIRQGKPLLGICRGHHVLNVCLGGTLWQDLPTQTANKICHYQDLSNRTESTHSISIQKDSCLYEILNKETILVNSFHHQAIKTLGQGLRVVAEAPDGTIEAVESEDGRIMGIQWHPEEQAEIDQDSAKLFSAFVMRCQQARKI